MEMIVLLYGFSARALFEYLLDYCSEKWRLTKIKFSIIRKLTIIPIMQRGPWFPPLVRGSGAFPSGTCSSKPSELWCVSKWPDQKSLFSRHFSSFLFKNYDLISILRNHLVYTGKYRFLLPEGFPEEILLKWQCWTSLEHYMLVRNNNGWETIWPVRKLTVKNHPSSYLSSKSYSPLFFMRPVRLYRLSHQQRVGQDWAIEMNWTEL